MLKYIFAGLLILVVWGLWWWLKLPLWIAILATVLIILVVVGIILWGILKARRAAKKIETVLAKQGAAQADAQNKARVDQFTKAAAACLEGRGYTVK